MRSPHRPSLPVPADDLVAWIETLRARLALGELRDVQPFELPDGTVVRRPAAYVEQLLAEVDHYRGLGLPTRTLPRVLEVQWQIAAELEALRAFFFGSSRSGR